MWDEPGPGSAGHARGSSSQGSQQPWPHVCRGSSLPGVGRKRGFGDPEQKERQEWRAGGAVGSGHRLGSEGGGGATGVLVGGCGAGSAVGTRGWLSCGHSGGHRCTQAHRRLLNQGGFFFF